MSANTHTNMPMTLRIVLFHPTTHDIAIGRNQ